MENMTTIKISTQMLLEIGALASTFHPENDDNYYKKNSKAEYAYRIFESIQLIPVEDAVLCVIKRKNKT